MTNATDILRDRADWRIQCAATAPHHTGLSLREEAGFLRAVADLVEATYSHVDGRDLLAELQPQHWHYCDILVRVNGKWKPHEGDWLKLVFAARCALERAITGESDAEGK